MDERTGYRRSGDKKFSEIEQYSRDGRDLSTGRHPQRPSNGNRPIVIAKPSKVLGVFGLSSRTNERDLYDVFSEFGQIEDIQIVFDNLTGQSRGFAFVYYEDLEDSRRAKLCFEGGLDMDGRLAHVDFSITKAPHQRTPGVYMGNPQRNSGVPTYRNNRRFYQETRRRDYRYEPLGNRALPRRDQPISRRSPFRHGYRSISRSRSCSSRRQLFNPYPPVDDDGYDEMMMSRNLSPFYDGSDSPVGHS